MAGGTDATCGYVLSQIPTSLYVRYLLIYPLNCLIVGSMESHDFTQFYYFFAKLIVVFYLDSLF
jgi:hypothetical protein